MDRLTGVLVAKTASLVFFYFGEDSYMKRLAQETVPVHLALEGYDRKVLLRHKTDFGSFELSQAAGAAADVEEIPTKENLVRALNELREGGYTTDLYVFSHGWDKRFRVSNGTYGDNGTVSAAFLEANVPAMDLRAVWQCNCYGSTMNPTWQKLGAKATAGSRFVSFYPTRFRGFIDRWRSGRTFGASVAESDTALVHTPVQAYITVDAASRLAEWDGNLLDAARVLGDNDASRRYFSKCWLGADTPQGVSGKVIMNRSSAMLIAGDRTITR